MNFTKTLETFNGHCLSPKSLRGRDIRKLTEKDVIGMCCYDVTFFVKRGPPRGTRKLTVFINENMTKFFKESLGSKWILGNNSTFLLRKHSKDTFGNKGDFGNFF